MKILTSMFHWTPEDGLFSQELSSLPSRSSENVFHRLYNDACDLGLTLISAKTNTEADYYVDTVDMYHGEIQGWNLLPTSDTLRRLPRLKHTRVLIIND
jgi:hypothetical protein